MAPTKKKKNNSDGWHSVKLEGAIANSEIGGLIGFEEMTDYKIENGIIVSAKSRDDKKVIKIV